MHQLLFHLLLILLPTQLGYHFWPEWAMVLGRRVDYLSPTVFVTDLLVIAIFLSWVIQEKIHIFRFTKKKLFLSIFILANIHFASNASVAIYFWVKAFEYICLGVYILNTKPKLSSTIFFLSIGVIYSSLIAVGQFVLQRSIGGPLWFLGERTFTNMSPGIAQFNVCKPFVYQCALVLRSYGTFPHPNVLGGFLAIMMPLMIHELRSRKLFYTSAIVLSGVALVLTFSRSAWIAAIMGIVFMISKGKNLLRPLIFSIAATALIAGTIGVRDESVVVRSALNNSALAMFWQAPVIGNGLGNFLIKLPEQLVSRQIYFLQPVHNIYLLILVEVGVVGLGAFGWTLHRALVSASKERKKPTLTVIFRLALITLLLLGLVDHYPVSLQQGQVLLTILLSFSLSRSLR